MAVLARDGHPAAFGFLVANLYVELNCSRLNVIEGIDEFYALPFNPSVFIWRGAEIPNSD